MNILNKNEVARDLLSFGSWIFYLVILARALIEPYRPFVDQMIITGIFLIIIGIFNKKYDYYISRGLVIAFFTSIFYNDIKFSIFVSIVFLSMIYSSFLINASKKRIIYGLIIGIVGILLGYFLSLYL